MIRSWTVPVSTSTLCKHVMNKVATVLRTEHLVWFSSIYQGRSKPRQGWHPWFTSEHSRWIVLKKRSSCFSLTLLRSTMMIREQCQLDIALRGTPWGVLAEDLRAAIAGQQKPSQVLVQGIWGCGWRQATIWMGPETGWGAWPRLAFPP